MDFFIHVPTGTLLASRSSLTPLAELAITQRNEIAVRVWFLGNGPDVSTPVVVQAIPAPYTRIVLSARPNDDLDEANLVFFLDDLTATGSGDGLHYAGILNTATAAAAGLFSAETRRLYGCYLDIDLLVSADPEDGRWTIVKQRAFQLYRAIWQGTEGVDPDAVPAYPAPGEIVTEAPEDGKAYGRKDGGWEEVGNGVLMRDGFVEITDAAKGIIRRSGNGTRWLETQNDDGTVTRTALALLAFLALATSAMGQTVRDLTTTNGTLQGTSLRINTATNFNLGGVTGSLAVEAQGGNHAIAARASDEADGAAFYGWSESGAPAMKLVQSNNFNSPALTIWRTPNGNDALSPAVLIAGSPTNGTNIAFKVQRGSTNAWSVNFNGVALLPPAATVVTQIDWAVSTTFTHSLTGNKTFTFTNSADGQTIIVRVINPASHSVTWPSVKWRVGTPPTQTASATDIYTFINIGGTIYGAQNADLR